MMPIQPLGVFTHFFDFTGTRFRHFDSTKQSSGHISEVATSLSSQSGMWYVYLVQVTNLQRVSHIQRMFLTVKLNY